MFAFIEGTLEEKTHERAIINVNGIGYECFIPINCYSELPPAGKSCRLYTSFIVREDSQRLFGFTDEGEKNLFNTLKDISGVGPKTALALVGHLDRTKFYEAIHASNATAISKVPGIGKKTAERLIVELRDKKMAQPARSSLQLDAIAALTSLGYNQAKAEKAVERAYDDTLELPLLITKALQM